MPSESKDLTREALTGFTSIEKLNAESQYNSPQLSKTAMLLDYLL